MQHFPPDKGAGRALVRRRRDEPAYQTEQHHEDDELAASRDWLGHVRAGRIAVR